jgi:hypothetical protein
MDRLLLLAVLLIATAPLSAWERYAPDVTQQRFEDTKDIVDHLVPYVELKKPGYYVAEFSAYPSFTNHREWRIYRKEQRFLLRSWEVPHSAKGLKPAPIHLVEIEIPSEVAAVVYEIWANALLEARYTRGPVSGLDGTSYRFSTYLRAVGWLHGYTWSPDANLPPKWMVDTGELLIAYARSADRDPKKLQHALAERKDQLMNYLQQKGKH